MKLVDLSISIEDGLPVDPEVQIGHIRYLKHDEELALNSMLEFFPGATVDDFLDDRAGQLNLSI